MCHLSNPNRNLKCESFRELIKTSLNRHIISMQTFILKVQFEYKISHVLLTNISFHFTFCWLHKTCCSIWMLFFLFLLTRYQYTLLQIVISPQFPIHSSRGIHWCSRKTGVWTFVSNRLVFQNELLQKFLKSSY